MRFLSFMSTPVGRSIRIGGGVALIAAGGVIGGGLGAGLAVFAVLPIATGVFGVCPISPLFGGTLRACPVPAQRSRRS
jgi:hypothetical protein